MWPRNSSKDGVYGEAKAWICVLASAGFGMKPATEAQSKHSESQYLLASIIIMRRLSWKFFSLLCVESLAPVFRHGVSDLAILVLRR